MGYICTFFGHRNAPSDLQPTLCTAIRELIACHNVDTFIAGNEGQFDTLVQHALSQLCADLPHIRSNIILPSLPAQRSPHPLPLPTLFPEELEGIPRRFSVHRRNIWMLRQCHFVIAYIRHPSNGADQFLHRARQQHKHIILL